MWNILKHETQRLSALSALSPLRKNMKNIQHQTGAAGRNNVDVNANAKRNYHPNVIDHYENPRNVGSVDETQVATEQSDAAVGTGIVGAPACGDVMKLQLVVDKNTGAIRDARFKTFGCGSAIASSSLATEMVKGSNIMTLGETPESSVRNVDIARRLHLPPVKLHCSMLAEDAVAQSVRNARSKLSSSFPRKK